MLRIISIGKTKESYLKEGIAEFLKRLKRETKIEYLEVKNKEQMLKHAKEGTTITLEIGGKQHSSEELAKFLKKEEIKGTLNFYIGDENGLPKEIMKNAQYKISLSKMTFTHEMARLILLEQLYRAYQINKGTKYHK